ncbi:MAG: tetratricopeptide repeat protein, partial [Proteobacteria bacterium]|nr:tetratricopeptide repeat protein [Pseudomonadota bacterium]
MKEGGTLLVIDYPEEHRSGVEEFLRYFVEKRPSEKIRVLFLTRQPMENWLELVADCQAENFVDQGPCFVGRLDESAAYSLYDTALTKLARELGTLPPPLTEEALTAWLNLAPENDRALFILAAAVHSALNPDDEVVRYTGSQVIDTLVQREVDRLRRIAKGQGADDPLVLARVLALAAIADEIPVKDVINLAGRDDLEFGFAGGANIEEALQAAGLLIDRAVPAPKPDILAAAFLVEVLGRKPATAPELVWAALSVDLQGGLERLGRLIHDAEFVLGILDHRLSRWLAQAVDDHPDRCQPLDPVFSQKKPLGWLEASVAVWQTLLKGPAEEEERARLLVYLSNDLGSIGDNPGALASIEEAVELFRRLSATDRARFETNLAGSLNNLSNRLSDTGDNPGALEAIQEAVDLYRRLAEANPARFEPDLAMSLNNLSHRLSDTGDNPGALEAIQEAVDLYRRLAKASPARFEPDLATSLNNLSNALSDAGDNQGALVAIQEAVAIRRRLAKTSPARFEPELARSLGTLGLV